MTDCVTFHTQLAYILDLLANKALEEICKVVDDGYAVLRLEVSRHQKENESLKRRLHAVEREAAQRCAERTESDLAQVCRTRRRSRALSVGSDGGHFPAAERAFGQQTGICLRGDREPTAIDDEDLPVSIVTKDEEGRPELLIIKEEALDDELGTNGPQAAGEIFPSGAVGSRVGGGERVSVLETQNKPENHAEGLTEQHRTRHGVWEVSGPESVLKAEAESESVKTLQHRGTERRAGGLNGLDSEFVMFERPAGQPGTYCPQGGANAEAEDPCCSYSTGTDFTDRQDLTGCDTTPCDTTLRASESVQTHFRDGVAKKLITCKYCGRGFARRNALEIHQRVHTGEKPFSCAQCGKQFAHSGNLKVHQSVHTGERRFSCSLCGKSFISSSHLKRHWNVHTRERPFGCAQCGKRFSDSGSRKRHQSVHAGEKLFVCAQCGKRFSSSGHLKRHRLQMHSSNDSVDLQDGTADGLWQQEGDLLFLTS